MIDLAPADVRAQDALDYPHDDPCPRCGRRQWTDEHAQETCQACGFTHQPAGEIVTTPTEPAVYYCAGHKSEHSSSSPPAQVDGQLYCNATDPRPFCEQRPYPGAGYWCLNRVHPPGTPHSDLTIQWDDNGNVF